MAEHTAEHATDAGHAADAASSGGMPQLDFATFPNQILWLVVALVVLYLILSRVALPRIGSVLAERTGTITNDIAAAETFKQQAAEAEAAYHQALDDARAAAAKVINDAKADIQKDLDVAIAKADAEIAARTAESAARIDEIRASATEAVTTVAKDTTKELLNSFGVKADARSVTAAVNAQLKGGAA
ncbi:F0F1 ATP synthase subunit B' [Pararhodobacter oceanensis]|uniref:ATP synthase subunit b n=1 Tax=Pararhodobacter oceanensis TaxID=2172121 RepID=A0A2T8HSJ1_9RHOB|nr:F0F1 ATP synthase subunit B' [Pararhodobacter oceanensis]PVH28409.1 ATP F0F1 synthase subunit B' [Pararhodobacter oceanensis]